MRGDGHTAYGGNSACIDAAVDAYLEERTLPAPGTTCRAGGALRAAPARPDERDGDAAAAAADGAAARPRLAGAAG